MMSDDLEKTSQLKVTGLMLKAKSDEATSLLPVVATTGKLWA